DLGWKTAATPRKMAPKKKGENNRPDPDYVVGTGKKKTEYRSDLLNSEILIDCFLADEQARVNEAIAAKDRAKESKEELEEEHATADGLLSEVINEKGNIAKPAVVARINQLEERDEERLLLERYQALSAELAEASRAVVEATMALNEK